MAGNVGSIQYPASIARRKTGARNNAELLTSVSRIRKPARVVVDRQAASFFRGKKSNVVQRFAFEAITPTSPPALASSRGTKDLSMMTGAMHDKGLPPTLSALVPRFQGARETTDARKRRSRRRGRDGGRRCRRRRRRSRQRQWWRHKRRRAGAATVPAGQRG